MMQQGERNVFNVQLMDGRSVDICTETGADAFLQAGRPLTKEYLCNNVGRMSQICAKRKLNARDKCDLVEMNLFFESISRYATHDVFRENVERSTIRTWLDYATGQIKRFAKNRNWITTGKLATHETSLLESCIYMMFHAVPVVCAFEGEFFNVLADLVKVRKGTGRALPCDDICETITLIVANANYVSRVAFDNPWTPERTLKKLEATGILEQFLRCATVPQLQEESRNPGFFKMLDELQACIPFISKRLQPGEPCGDIIIAILEGKDGSRVQRPSVLSRFHTITKFASSIDPNYDCGDGYKICRNCGKSDYSEAFQKSLMKCARCHQAYYCSKECQKADWKVHKKTCAPQTRKDVAMSKNIQQTVLDFCNRQYAHVMVKMIEACDQTGLPMKDMIVELSFKANENGVVPAMQDKPELKVAPVKDYIEGSRPAEPDWFYKNIDQKVYKNNLNMYLTTIKEKHQKRQPNQILCLLNYDGGFSCYSIAIVDPTTRKDTYTEEALLAFRAYMNDEDDEPLSEMLDPQYFRMVKQQLFRHYDCGLPDMQSIRDMMNRIRMYDEANGGGLSAMFGRELPDINDL